MNFVRCLFILEKIIIVIILLTFVPIAIYLYLAQPIPISTQITSAYTAITTQFTANGFLVGLKSISACQPPTNIIFYSNCYERCTLGSTCFLTPSNRGCLLSYNYNSNDFKICTSQSVYNQIQVSSNTFSLNTSNTPISSISINNNALSIQYYCIANISACQTVISFFGDSIQRVFQLNYESFKRAGTYLMNYGLIPLIIHIIVVLLLDLGWKFNLRLTNSLLVVHQALVGIGIIVNGFSFNERNEEIMQNFNLISQYCLIKDTSYCNSNFNSPFANFNESDHISGAFNISMAFVLVLQILCLIVIVVVNVLINKYYKMREIQPSSSGYELHTM